MQQIVMARTAAAPDADADDVESEPVVINTDDPKVVSLTLDDGKLVEFDRSELAAALEQRAA